MRSELSQLASSPTPGNNFSLKACYIGICFSVLSFTSVLVFITYISILARECFGGGHLVFIMYISLLSILARECLGGDHLGDRVNVADFLYAHGIPYDARVD